MKKLFFILLLSTCYLVLTAQAGESASVRVSIIEDIDSLRLNIHGFYEIQNPSNNKIVYRGKNLNSTVTAYRNGILMGNADLHLNRAIIKAEDAEAIVINGRKFRGDIQFIKKDNAHLAVINHIALEDYVKGILYHEASHYWPYDALKAQAIVCRTYAIYEKQQNKGKDYDLRSDIYSQVYGGKTSERYRTNKAVDDTAGLVLTYQGKVFPTYYHATCAGHTEDASLLWNTNIAPLKGVVCNFCKDSPHFNWQNVLPKNEVIKKLEGAGYKIKSIKDIVIEGKDPSGRIANLKILTDKKDIIIPSKDLRNTIGPNIVRSTNFSVNIMNNDVVFQGLGWGHGVGMCQWGAYFMAKQGFNYEQILKYYYPGAEISSLLSP